MKDLGRLKSVKEYKSSYNIVLNTDSLIFDKMVGTVVAETMYNTYIAIIPMGQCHMVELTAEEFHTVEKEVSSEKR